ncbi:MAG: RNA polymerase sigma factor [Kordiimonas sp.]
MDGKQRALLQTWYERYGDELYRTLCRAAKSADMSEEIIQETFLKVAAHVSKADHAHLIGNPRAFLYKVAYNELYTRHRRKKLEQHLNGVFADTEFEVSDAHLAMRACLPRISLSAPLFFMSFKFLLMVSIITSWP